MLGGPGPDTLTSHGANDSVAGGPGADVLTLAGSGDTSLGLDGDGDQVRIRGAGYIVLSGQRGGPLEVDLEAGTVRRVGAATGDIITNIGDTRKWPVFVVYGTSSDDRISGRDDSGYGDQLWGSTGNDVLSGRGGDDILDGGPGDDVLDGGYGRDSAIGGRGTDICWNAQVESCSP